MGHAQRDLFCRWACDRHERAMPHLKSYGRFDPDRADNEPRRFLWFLMTSANMSKVTSA